ncbi:hypothetical protein A2Y99_00595 [Candidatus Gottesmanbacteria bacterium RBG_13_37_7]|uniref:Undecaprenyl-phosphate alpha-N-acetylglucosaminyl 1-phosphate transferase n=1 Tax=Candidatus Gottesmanbacteria bacterium RBG_13_37_7 TaxID=1798369 RepID=A0A1F5YGU8_9BACT|nr:MAG: hypothetical protein A2Y99_00595 [Candidatus Gottesmanbacteria bacterium RBG_13_37_7]
MIFLLIFVSSAICYLAVPPVINLARKYGLVDNPKTRFHPAHTHKGIIPRAGGLPIFIGILIPSIIFFPLSQQIVSIIIASAILVFVGLWDDKRDRSPYVRLLTNSLAAATVIVAGINIPYITNPFGGILNLDRWIININIFGWNMPIIFWSGFITFIWIIWLTNIIGWSGGVDGQLPGFVSISAFIIGLLSLRFAREDPNQIYVTMLSFITAGAFLGFLPWNFFPQKMMPGYGGKTLAGFILAVLSILSFSKLGTAILVLAVPITDAAVMFLKRLISGKSPVWATSEHLHHHLLYLGWSKRKIAVFYWIISAVAGTIALFLNSRQKIFVSVLMLIVIFGFIFWINLIVKITVGDNNSSE